MGRSNGTTSCFKLIACGGGGNESVDRDDLEAVSETRGSSDRSRWSFRKKSARHRVLNNSVASEAPSGNKDSSDSAIGGFSTQGSSTTPDKHSVIQWSDEKPQLQIPVESKLSETTETVAAEDENKADERADEESIIIIQAAIRRFLAQKIFAKHKNVIKLQAAIRGHIVRRHAVGSLRCVQAIVKMQHLVRERRARLLLDKSSTKEKGKETTALKQGTTSTSTEKLLSNPFARQLLESTSKTKAIYIKCDPSKPDSAWRWLERWMSVSSTESGQAQELEPTVEQPAMDNIEEADNHLETVISSPENSQSRDEVYVDALQVPLESDENVITYEVDNYKIQEPQPIVVSSAVTSNDQFDTHSTGDIKSSVEDSSSGLARELDKEPESFNVLSDMDNEQNIPTVETHDTDESEIENKQKIPTVETPGIEESEMDGKNSSIVSRKASNPAFIAAQTKFEELSSSASLNKSKSVGSSNLEVSVDSSLEAELPVNNHTSRASEIDHAESSLSQNFTAQVNGSECGTELSISSTLDSPDRSEAGVVESVPETKSADEIADNPKNDFNSNVEEKIESTILVGDSSNSYSIVQEIDDSSVVTNGERVGSSEIDDSNTVASRELTKVDGDSSEAEQKPVTATTEAHMEEEIETSHPVRRSSPEASPISHVTVADSTGTPSSQVSVKSKKTRSAKNGSIRKNLSNGKESRFDTNHDHGARNSSEPKNGKRRNSFGSTKTDHSDNQEPRDSSSSNSLPSYMQPTESARAKALPHNSPRSSPDMQDKDLLIRKRHSLPGESTRQGSPRVIRTQQQGAKGSETQSPQERKWRR